MSATGTVLKGRRRAESLMVDACTVEHATGQTLDEDPASPTYGQYVTTYETVYQGRCKVQMNSGVPSTPRAGGQEFTIQRTEVHLPVVGSEGVRPDHRVTVTAATLDAGLVGRVYTVASIPAKSFATARRLVCEEVTA